METEKTEAIARLERIAGIVKNYSAEEIGVIRNSVAKGTSDTELSYFIMTCNSVGLNPLVKEIWCYKDTKGNLIIFAGRDGFLKKAQESPSYNGIRSSEVRENDIFEMDIFNAKITHKKNVKNPGKIYGAYAVVFRKDGEPTIEWADFDVYDKKYSTWKTHPTDMIKKVAETHALKKAFGISGIQTEFDFEVVNDKVIPIDTEGVDIDRVLYAEQLIRTSAYDDDQKAGLERELKTINNTVLDEMIENLKDNQCDPMDMPNYNMGDIQKHLDKIV